MPSCWLLLFNKSGYNIRNSTNRVHQHHQSIRFVGGNASIASHVVLFGLNLDSILARLVSSCSKLGMDGLRRNDWINEYGTGGRVQPAAERPPHFRHNSITLL